MTLLPWSKLPSPVTVPPSAGSAVTVTIWVAELPVMVTVYSRMSALRMTSVASIPKLNVPAVAGVPEISPVLESRLNPSGRLPQATLKNSSGKSASAMTSIGAVYASFTAPPDKLFVVIFTGLYHMA